MAGPRRFRHSIDALSPQQLADYEHALQQLQRISETDPESIDGYTYFEQLHDGDKGPCEHANDTFMPWHRAHLWLFEEALRRSDPPRTEHVTVPYWDWSALPSGVRYPKRSSVRARSFTTRSETTRQSAGPPPPETASSCRSRAATFGFTGVAAEAWQRWVKQR